jgi:hypothetical protein
MSTNQILHKIKALPDWEKIVKNTKATTVLWHIRQVSGMRFAIA